MWRPLATLKAPWLSSVAFPFCAVVMGLGLYSTSSAQDIPQIQQVQVDLSHQDTLYQVDTSAPVDLYEAWHLSLLNDPSFQAERRRAAAAQEQLKISRSGLLPQVSLGYQKSRVTGWEDRTGMFGMRQRVDLRYDSSNFYAQLRQPLLNYSSYAEYQRGKAVASHGQAQLEANRQRFALQLIQNYFEIILTVEDWRMQKERVRFLEEREHGFQLLVQHDHGTLTDLLETQARLAIAQAELVKVADHLRLSVRQLQTRVGTRPTKVQSLSRAWGFEPLAQDLYELTQRALMQNKEIQTARQEMTIYKARLDAATGQYLPTLDFTASFRRGDSEDLSTRSQRTNTYSFGLNLNIPIFTGGYTTAARFQAGQQYRQAQHRYDSVVGRTESEVYKHYSTYTSGIHRVQALHTAVKSNELSLDSALKSFNVGAASNLDVLDAQDELIEARYEFFQSRLDVLLAQFQLLSTVGQRLDSAIQQISSQHFQGGAVSLPQGLSTWEDSVDGWTLFTIQPTYVQSPNLKIAPAALSWGEQISALEKQ